MLATIDLKNKTVNLFDSLVSSRSSAQRINNILKRYIQDEYEDKIGGILDMRNWSFESNSKGPKQHDGSSCGVFVCLSAKKFVLNKPIRYSQNDVDSFRSKMAFDLAMCQCVL